MDYLGNDLKSVLVTGARGFLGRKVSSLLCGHYQVYNTSKIASDNLYQCDLLQSDAVHDLICRISPDLIVHCAAEVPLSFSSYNNQGSANNNLMMIQNLVSSTRCPILNISSMTVYDANDCSTPMKETDAGSPNSAYATGKWKCEQFLQSLDRPTLSVRIPGLYGIERKSGLVYNTINSAISNHSVALPDSPLMWAAMHVNDASAAVAALVSRPWNGFTSVNCGYKGKFSVNYLLSAIDNLTGSNLLSSYPNINHPVFEFDLTRASVLDIIPSTDLFNSLALFISELNSND